jgi:hypothetical protein
MKKNLLIALGLTACAVHSNVIMPTISAQLGNSNEIMPILIATNPSHSTYIKPSVQ